MDWFSLRGKEGKEVKVGEKLPLGNDPAELQAPGEQLLADRCDKDGSRACSSEVCDQSQ